MRRTLQLLMAGVGSLCLAVPVLAQSQSGVRPPAMALENGRWFDGERFTPDEFYVVDGRMTRNRPEQVDATFDLQGKYVLPGLIDAHNHNFQNGPFAAFSNQRTLQAGVYHSVQMCSRPDQTMAFAGFLQNPGNVEVLFTDACFSGSDGHPLGIALASTAQMGEDISVEEAHQSYDPVDTVEDLDALWPAVLERSPRLIKVILINSERRAAELQDRSTFGYRGLDPVVAREIVRRAHLAGVRVAAHVDSAADFALAVEIGADIIAHLPGYRIAENMTADDYRISDAAISAAADRKTIVITTAGAARHAMQRRPERAGALRAMQIQNLTRLVAAGVPIAMGSDDVMGSVVDEIVYVDALGIMPREQLLRLSTADTARAMFPDRTMGEFVEGAEATFNVYAADPLQDLSALRHVFLGVQSGTVLASKRGQ